MISLREATIEDVDILFEWANDPVVRKNSFNTKPIPYEDHRKWFDKVLSDDSVIQFIMMEEETPVGQIRLNVNGDEAEIGYSIAAAYRGHGYGHMILKLVLEKIESSHTGIKKLIAKVKPDNSASKRLFESEGYKMKYFCYTLDTMLETTD